MCIQVPCVYLLSPPSAVIRNTYTLWAPEVSSTVTFSGQSFSKTLFPFAFTSWMSFLTFLSSLANSRFLETHLMTFFSASNCCVLWLSKVFRYAGLSSSLSLLICKFYHVQTIRKLEPIYNTDIKMRNFTFGSLLSVKQEILFIILRT